MGNIGEDTIVNLKSGFVSLRKLFDRNFCLTESFIVRPLQSREMEILQRGPMKPSNDLRWLKAAILLGILYLVVGVTFGALANTPSHQLRFAWRLAAWLVSAAAFAAHIAYEHFRR